MISNYITNSIFRAFLTNPKQNLCALLNKNGFTKLKVFKLSIKLIFLLEIYSKYIFLIIIEIRY